MRTLILLLLCFGFNALEAQHSCDLKSIALRQNSIYLVCRGTQQKMGFIAEKFNLKDKNITHVGIGIVENDSLIIYNVNNIESGNSALQIENPKTFTAPPDVFYFSLWEYRSTSKAIKKLKKILKRYTLKPIVFDMNFNEKDNENLYCSEFCAKVLLELYPTSFSFPLTEKKLDQAYSGLLERKILRYYPVDFFQIDNRFHKVYEAHF